MSRLLRAGAQINRIPEVLRCRTLTHDWLPLTVAYIGLRSKLPFSIRLPSGRFEFREQTDIPTFWQIFLANLYRVRPSDRVIFDVGANIGAFTLYALLANPNCHVVSVEPALDTFERLQSLMVSHGLSNRCTLVHAALSSESGITTIQTCPVSQIRVTGKDGVAVRAVTLNELSSPYDHIDLLKFDAEGAEYTALPAASRDTLCRIKRIEMEYHPWGNPQELFALLTDCGFSLESSRDNSGAPGYGMATLSRP